MSPKRKRLPPNQWKHGRNCYHNHGCRCPICVTDAQTYHRERYVRKQYRDHPPPRPVDDDLGHTWPELVAAEIAKQEQS